jgi:hypothetical protein
MLPLDVEKHLSEGDDPALWAHVLRTVAEDAATLDISNGAPLYAEVGRCSHWLRPHQTRWTAAGGFAFPIGYGDGEGFGGIAGLPGLDWSVRLLFVPASAAWDTTPTAPPKRSRAIRVAVPSRTARHRQAAVHTLWSRGTLHPRQKQTIFYGFRKVNGVWELKARSGER